ncbi:hypothetical protein H1220_06370 [Carnobacteriaceae bacterium zg-84]|uniref:hypothetical protein n=1 Tax=Granulicatella sp. zg-84 TaxID=2678503 RepID=UPI0013C058ED|nr:hypothetical protein [Granulicatella sp. zg-84]NEW66814.1 hypothetical protein [Granulicatella sp. zg-84]QMI85343.1 hypothetical protein H1220_06370 [Carnobacteriaceae bacterium zg-84]
MTEKRKGYTDPKLQAEANKRWSEKNKEYRAYLTSRSSARGFIRNKATQEDLNELKILIQEREEQLKYTE